MTIQRTDTAVALSTKDLPTEAVNPLAPLVLVSAVIPDGTNTVVVTFNSDATDDGGPLNSYTGDARAYSCTKQVQLTIGVAAVQANDGTIAYDVLEIIDAGEVIEFTAAGVLTTCEPGPQELVTFGDFSTVSQVDFDANWTDTSTGSGAATLELANGLNLTDGGPFDVGRIEQPIAIVAGNLYDIVIDIKEKRALGGVRILLGSLSGFTEFTTTGVKVFSVAAGVDDLLLKVNTDAVTDLDDWIIGSISVKDA